MDKYERSKLHEELNNLSEFEEQNKERMKEIAKVLVDDYIPKKEVDDYEFKHLRICRHGIQRENCYSCLFEASCHLEQYKEQNEGDDTLNDVHDWERWSI